jgi:ribosomal protein S18 acetylase RimI-like enzyme
VIAYRPFRNTDPPAIAAIWNECFTGRGACILRMQAPLERAVFSKLYFDPAGLILAVDGGQPIGFVHAGFGPNAAQTDIDTAAGVICAVAVRLGYRRQGIGTELVRRAEAYLAARGATAAFAGPHRPLNPFYLSIYGGGGSPGFLQSDPDAARFFEKHGYVRAASFSVLQRRLDRPITISDPRFPLLRKRCEVVIQPRIDLQSWWQEGTTGSVEPVEIRLEDRAAGVSVGRSLVWEMEGFSWRWNAPAAGILDLVVNPDQRRQGLGRFFLAHILRYLQEQYFGICECHVVASDAAATALLTSMGFDAADAGQVFRKPLSSATVPA